MFVCHISDTNHLYDALVRHVNCKAVIYHAMVRNMIRYRLKELIADKEFAERRKITIIEISEQTGIARSTLSRLNAASGYNTTTEVLDKLCKYFDCQTNQVAEYIPDEN